MIFRTDLAKETYELRKEKKGIVSKRINSNGIEGDWVQILYDMEDSGKKAGNYISFETDAIINRNVEFYENISKALAEKINELIKETDKTVLVVGLGNESMTPDSIGPKVIKKIFVTRHIFEFLPDEKDQRMSSVCAVAPGVLGVTGIESADVISGICRNIDVGAVIVIDALAARKSERMFSTFQLTDTGIHPGAGVGNKRSPLSKEFLGIPVIAIGVPTVVYASSLVYDAAMEFFDNSDKNEVTAEKIAQKLASFSDRDMVVTPKEVDVIIEDCAKIIADGINLSLQKNMSIDEINAYMF